MLIFAINTLMSMNRTVLFLILTTIIIPFSAFAGWRPHTAEAGVTFITSGGRHAPFWLLSNREGRFLPEDHAAALDLSVFSRTDTLSKLRFGYGLEVFGRASDSSRAHLHQAYAYIQWKDLLQLRAGRWTNIVGSREPALSSGSIIWSGNARPMTRVEISTPDYITIPYTGGLLELKGLMAHGWFEQERFVEGVWMHHKNLYGRFGGSFPVNLVYGFNHYAQWAGQSPVRDEPFPSDLEAFIRVFLNRSGSESDPTTPPGWAVNKFGNSLGSRNYGIELTTASLEAGIYWQDVFEDNSGLNHKNFPDGLWGLHARFTGKQRVLQAFVLEVLHTKDQSGPTHNDPEGNVVGGNDNYFNHGHYRSGWTYHKFTIGTPLLTSPIFNESSIRLLNNRVLAYHFGAEGHLGPDTRYRGLFTYSRNYGLHSIPFAEPIDQLSVMLELTRPLRRYGLDIAATLAGDIGRLYGDNIGVMLSIRKRWVRE